MKLHCALACMTLLFAVTITPAIPNAVIIPPSAFQQNDTEISTYALETSWYYRIYNGVYQKRLWSVIQQKWLTGWMDV